MVDYENHSDILIEMVVLDFEECLILEDIQQRKEEEETDAEFVGIKDSNLFENDEIEDLRRQTFAIKDQNVFQA